MATTKNNYLVFGPLLADFLWLHVQDRNPPLTTLLSFASSFRRPSYHVRNTTTRNWVFFMYLATGLVNSFRLVYSWPKPAPPRHRRTYGHLCIVVAFQCKCHFLSLRTFHTGWIDVFSYRWKKVIKGMRNECTKYAPNTFVITAWVW